jgi:hypothetical protein
MIVMPSNWSKAIVHYWGGAYPGALGHLYSPGSQRGPWPWLPYALDNGRFACWAKGAEWDEVAYTALLEWAHLARMRGQAPLWALVPDVVADREGTLREWDRWVPLLKSFKFPIAFAVQDGMLKEDVPTEADVVFVGGTTAWKWLQLPYWCQHFPRVHVGRVNSYRRLVFAERCGAESVDGTGWGRGDQVQLGGLVQYLRECAGEQPRVVQEGLPYDE